MIERSRHVTRLLRLLRELPVVALLGPRQVGKTTLARAVARAQRGAVTSFDLENDADLAALADPMLTLAPLRGLVVIDEVQARPDLFRALRVLVDRPRRPSRFLVLGSASPELLRQSSETLAGRVGHHELEGFTLDEIGVRRLNRLWLRGGFPRSFLATSEAASQAWRTEFVRTFLERDLAQLGLGVPASTLRRFWSMLAHYHAQIWNASELGRAFGVADTTVRRYLDALTATFMIRQLRPWAENLAKRQVRSPKVYVADSGVLHTLLDAPTRGDLDRHPKVGASWEGFVVGQLVTRLGARPEECYFWATHQGAELDLLVVRGGRRVGFEVKRTTAPQVTPSMRIAQHDLKLASLDVVHAGSRTFPLSDRIRAVACERILEDVAPL